MAILAFLLHLLSGATLLLFAVRFMRIGIERLWSNPIRQNLGETSATLPLLAKGAALGFAMQGATVVMLMAAAMVSSSSIPLVSAILLTLGADFGSALAVRFLTLPVSAIGPLAILFGGWLYLNSPQPRRKNLGRVILGLGLVFLSLGVIREAVKPLQELSQGSQLVAIFRDDPITVAIAGIVLTMLMHSSLAALLTGLFIASHADLGLLPCLGYVLGCNIGSALLPLWLLRNEPGEGLRVAQIVALLRCGLAVPLLGALMLARPLIAGSAWVDSLPDSASMMLYGHIGFNFALLCLAPLARYLGRRVPPKESAGRNPAALMIPPGETDPAILISALKTGLNRMLETLAEMFEQVTSATPDAGRVMAAERRMNRGLSALRVAFAGLPELPPDATTNVRQIVDFAIRIERSADLLSGKYLDIRQEQLNGEFSLSPEGAAEVNDLAAEVRKALILAQNLVWSQDSATARRLVAHKKHVAALEEESRRKHLQRVSIGNLTSLSSSDQHLELIAALKEINSKLATIAYAILSDLGGQAETGAVTGSSATPATSA